MLLSELIVKIKMLATQIGVEAAMSPLLDSDALIELVLPRVIDYVTMDLVKDEQQLQALRTDHTLTFASGFASLPSTVKEEYAESIFFAKNGASYVQQWYEYRNDVSTMFDRFTVLNGNIYYRAPSESVTGHSGNEIMNAITYPSLPATESTAVSIKANILEQIISLAVSVITGQVLIAHIGLDYQTIQARKVKSA